MQFLQNILHFKIISEKGTYMLRYDIYFTFITLSTSWIHLRQELTKPISHTSTSLISEKRTLGIQNWKKGQHSGSALSSVWISPIQRKLEKAGTFFDLYPSPVFLQGRHLAGTSPPFPTTGMDLASLANGGAAVQGSSPRTPWLRGISQDLDSPG